MITIFRLHLIVCGFLMISLSLGGCSSSDVADETSEGPADSALSEDEYGEAEGDELGFEDDGEGGEFEDDEFAGEGLPEDAPLDLEDDPLLSDGEEGSGLPELPVADGESTEDSGLPALSTDDQDQSQFTSESDTSFDGFDDSVSQGPGMIPVKKIKSYPYNRAGMLVNAVYIARSDDDLDSISQRIYGADRVADLLSINPNLQRGVDVGDKVYYNSPSRPTDSQNLLFYYEDVGVGPQQYTVGRGENIRNIAEQLFGERESWKELWATNLEVESKWALDEGVVLRYWSGDSVPIPVASNEVIQEPEIVQEDNFEVPPPPQEQVPDIAGTGDEVPGADNIPPPDAGAGDFADNNIPPPPPPPPPPPSLEQPPPRPLAADSQAQDGVGGLLGDDDSLLFLIVGVVVVMFMLMIAVRRKAKRRKMRMNMGDTQI